MYISGFFFQFSMIYMYANCHDIPFLQEDICDDLAWIYYTQRRSFQPAPQLLIKSKQ